MKFSLPQEGQMGPPVRQKKSSLPQEGQLGPPVRHPMRAKRHRHKTRCWEHPKKHRLNCIMATNFNSNWGSQKINVKQCFFFFPAKLGKRKCLCIEVFSCIGFGGLAIFSLQQPSWGGASTFPLPASTSTSVSRPATGPARGLPPPPPRSTEYHTPRPTPQLGLKRALVPYGWSRTRTRRGLRGPSHAPHTHTDLNNHSDGTLTHNFHIHSLCFWVCANVTLITID